VSSQTTSRVRGAVDDELWSAIGDPTRRRMLDLLLADGAGTATSLSAQLPVTRQAVAKHLVVLDRAGLIRSHAAGRERRYDVDAAQLERALDQLAQVGAAWDRRLQRIKKLAESITEQAQSRPTAGAEGGPQRDQRQQPHGPRRPPHDPRKNPRKR
jgi:DNA-binding transcriptional ArsR family regulator